jgi:uncharacterized protein (DUF111 family)
MALVRTFAAECGLLPPMAVFAVGVGAGGRDVRGRPNVTRVVLGEVARTDGGTTTMWVLETNVDDLDPRVWPTVLAALLEAGAADAWLVPVLMKKGRPAHTLCVLTAEAERAALRTAVFRLTGTLGVREAAVARTALERAWVSVAVPGGQVRVKLGLHDGRITVVTPEFEDAAAVARRRDLPVRQVLDEAAAAATAQGLTPDAPWTATGP